MSASDQAEIDAAWGETVARVSSHLAPAAIMPPMSFHSADRLHHAAGSGMSRAAIDASWASAVARVNAEEGLGPAPSDVRPG